MSDPRLSGTEIHGNVLSVIGNTPLVALPRLMAAEGLKCLLTMKMEQLNPGGSAKDRPALEMIEAAEREGLLKPGDTIIEPTSGNTGIGLAIAAAQKGYDCVFVVTNKLSPEKISLLRAYGARVEVCPVAVPPESPDSYYSVAERLASELGAFRPNQYMNPNNPAAHEKTTGPEIWRQTAGRVTHFVAGAGTSGSLTGVARFLKAQNPDVRIVAADPDRSVFSGGDGRPYLVEGVGEDFFPAAWDPSLYDEVIPVSDAEAFAVARQVSRQEGILIGGSGGLAVAAALKVARAAGPDDLIVVLNPDSGRGYLSRVYDDGWMASHGFETGRRVDAPAVADVLATVAVPFMWADPDQPASELAARLANVPALPVAGGEPPFALAELHRAVYADDLLALHASGRWDPDASAAALSGPALPLVGMGEPLSVALERLAGAAALLVVDAGHPVAVLTKKHLRQFFSATTTPGGSDVRV